MRGRRFNSAAVVAVCAHDRLLGLATIERLFAAPGESRMADVMDSQPPTVMPGTDQEHAAWQAVKHGEPGQCGRECTVRNPSARCTPTTSKPSRFLDRLAALGVGHDNVGQGLDNDGVAKLRRSKETSAATAVRNVAGATDRRRKVRVRRRSRLCARRPEDDRTDSGLKRSFFERRGCSVCGDARALCGPRPPAYGHRVDGRLNDAAEVEWGGRHDLRRGEIGQSWSPIESPPRPGRQLRSHRASGPG
jgi:hypothetical protein